MKRPRPRQCRGAQVCCTHGFRGNSDGAPIKLTGTAPLAYEDREEFSGVE